MTQLHPVKPLADVLAEARRLHTAAAERRIAVRLLGGAGVALHAHGTVPPPLQRVYRDLDYVVARASWAAWRDMLPEFGYEADLRFNTLHGRQRLLHVDRANGRQLDTFVGSFEMCQTLDLDDRLDSAGPSLAPVDLLLTKLQVIEINQKDITDILLLLADHPVVSGDPEGVDPRRLAFVLGGDWGWYTTVTDNLAIVAASAEAMGLNDELRHHLRTQIDALRAAADSGHRSIRWRIRSLIGRRAPWYDLPEEVSSND